MFFVERASPACLLAVPRTAGGFLVRGPSLARALRAAWWLLKFAPGEFVSCPAKRQFCREQNWTRFSAPVRGRAKDGADQRNQREGRPDGATSPCASRRNRRSPQLAGRKLRASGSNTRLASPDSGCGARVRHTGSGKTIQQNTLRYSVHAS